MKKHIKILLAVAVIATGPVLRADCWDDYANCVDNAEHTCAGYEEPWECQQQENWLCNEDLWWCINS